MSVTDKAVSKVAGNITEAAVGVIQAPDGAVLLGQRPAGKPWSVTGSFRAARLKMANLRHMRW
jgi:hypothetical protein